LEGLEFVAYQLIFFTTLSPPGEDEEKVKLCLHFVALPEATRCILMWTGTENEGILNKTSSTAAK
jgi:hypothetical protein